MRVIVTGGRNFRDTARIHARLSQLPAGTTIVHGAAPGVDRLAHVAALRLGFRPEPHPAAWAVCGTECNPDHRRYNPNGKSYCPGAGHRRNSLMASLGADLCIAFPGGNGTSDMIECARAAHIPVEEVGA